MKIRSEVTKDDNDGNDTIMANFLISKIQKPNGNLNEITIKREIPGVSGKTEIWKASVSLVDNGNPLFGKLYLLNVEISKSESETMRASKRNPYQIFRYFDS